MPAPLAYLLTWTTHGTWLHGDERGSVDHSGERGFGRPSVPPQRGRVGFERAELKTPPLILTNAMRQIVERTIRDHLAIRGWSLHALHVRTTHIHLVASGDAPPERVMDQCKSSCTRRLREADLVGADAKV